MHTSKRTPGLAALLTLIAALVFLVAPAPAANSRPAGMTWAEYQALMLRSQALNEKYGLGAAAAGKPAAMSWPEYRALMLRSRALNQKYGLAGFSAATQPQAPTVVGNEGFAWGDFGLGAAAMLGLVLVAGGIAAGRRLPRTRIS
jgi:hypothetical protein